MARVIPFTGAEDDAHVIKAPRIGKVRQVIVGTIEINIVVVVAAEKITDVERATQADQMADQIRMAQGDIRRVISSETRGIPTFFITC